MITVQQEKKILFKLSGDLLKKNQRKALDRILKRIRWCAKRYKVTACIGGGTHIDRNLLDHGIQPEQYGKLGRKVKSEHMSQIMLSTLKKNQRAMRRLFKKMDIPATVEIPRHYIGGVLCHVNGDFLVLSAFHGFDLSIVFTEKDNKPDKQAWFDEWQKDYDCKKIFVLGFSERIPKILLTQ